VTSYRVLFTKKICNDVGRQYAFRRSSPSAGQKAKVVLYEQHRNVSSG
jgi:hypothetical protein